MAIRSRGAGGRIVSTTVCGRRHCRLCGRWRSTLDFGVKQWADHNRTRPRYLKSECDTCHARVMRRRGTRPECKAYKKAYDARRYAEIVRPRREFLNAVTSALQRDLERVKAQLTTCAWCGKPKGHTGRLSICHACDDEGWVRLPDGSYIEEGELAVFRRQAVECNGQPSPSAVLAVHEQLALAA